MPENVYNYRFHIEIQELKPKIIITENVNVFFKKF